MGLLFHTNLRASLSSFTTASDASEKGGAVGVSHELTGPGQEFARADKVPETLVEIPVLVLSLFNGVGCTFRCYDACGVVPLVAISYEISAEANRVVARRWPNVELKLDVRSLTASEVRGWRFKYPQVEEVHIWGGFPCIDLSSAKAFRRNLEGPGSSLFWELVRVIKVVRQVFGFRFPVKYGAENVASMDFEAEQEISQALGVHPYPQSEDWLQEGAVWPGGDAGAILPTAMKSIKRVRPPPRPAGVERCDYDTLSRWEADSFRYPPYQYDQRFIVWVGSKWRLVRAASRTRI